MSVQQKKKILTPIFNKYIRLRECLETTGSTLQGVCCTCGEVKPLEGLDAGHFISTRFNIFKYDEKNVHIQCRKCNGVLKGNMKKYNNFMRVRYGNKIVDYMQATKYNYNKFTEGGLDGMIKDYRGKLKEIEGEQ